jgi:hypothetical protein
MLFDADRFRHAARRSELDLVALSVCERERVTGSPFAACDGEDGSGVEASAQQNDSFHHPNTTIALLWLT